MRELFDAGHRGEGGGEVLELRRAAENAVGDLRPGRGVTIELEEQGKEAVLGLTVSEAGRLDYKFGSGTCAAADGGGNSFRTADQGRDRGLMQSSLSESGFAPRAVFLTRFCGCKERPRLHGHFVQDFFDFLQ
jgi:hypothetical protein